MRRIRLGGTRTRLTGHRLNELLFMAAMAGQVFAPLMSSEMMAELLEQHARHRRLRLSEGTRRDFPETDTYVALTPAELRILADLAKELS